MAHHGEFCKPVEHRHPYSKAVSHLLPQRSLYLVKPLAPPSCNSLALFIWFSGVGSRAKANSRMSKSACTRVAMPLATRLQICVLMHCLFCLLTLSTPVTLDEWVGLLSLPLTPLRIFFFLSLLSLWPPFLLFCLLTAEPGLCTLSGASSVWGAGNACVSGWQRKGQEGSTCCE